MMMEIGSARAASKLAAAEDEISKRLNELPLTQGNVEELRALLSAINMLDRAKVKSIASRPSIQESHS